MGSAPAAAQGQSGAAVAAAPPEGYGRSMRERRPAPEQHVEQRSERAGGSLHGRDARQLASQMGNVAFTALARSLARQPDEVIEFPPDYIGPGGEGQGPTVGPDGTIEFPPEHIGPSGEEPTVGPDGIIEFPPDYIGPTGQGQGQGPTVGPDGILEFPPAYIGPTGDGQGATVAPDGSTIEFPPDYVGPSDEGQGSTDDSTIEFPPEHITADPGGAAGAGAAAGAAGGSAG